MSAHPAAGHLRRRVVATILEVFKRTRLRSSLLRSLHLAHRRMRQG
jgi:hypothetical protein